jgi:hypothetical protein
MPIEGDHEPSTWPHDDEYQQKTDRPIPVVLLAPVEG